MFGFGGGKKGKGKTKPSATEDDFMQFQDPEDLMKGLETDPALLKELRALGLDEGDMSGPVDATSKSKASKQTPPAKKAQETSAVDSFLGNMDFDLELENVAKLGLTAELGDHGELDEADLQDPELLSALGEMGWTEEDEARAEEDPEPSPPAPGPATTHVHPPKEKVVAPVVARDEPHPPPPPEPKNENHMEALRQAVADSRNKALALKKENKLDEAVAELKHMRNLENELKVRESMGSITDIAKSVSLRLAPDEDQHAEAREEDGPSDSEPPTSTRTTSDAPAPSSPEKSSSVGQNRIEQLKQEVESKKLEAVQMKKQGYLEEALSLLRQAKALEVEIQRLQLSLGRRNSSSGRNLAASRKTSAETEPVVAEEKTVVKSAPSPAPVPPRNDAFTPLVDALKDAEQQAINRAKKLKETDKQSAVVELRKAKEYKALRDRVQETRVIPGARPPPFQWRVTAKAHKKTIDSIPRNAIEVIIGEGKEIFGARRDTKKAASKEKVLVTYDMGFPKDSPITGSTEVVTSNAEAGANFNFNNMFDCPRTKSAVLAFQRKHVKLEVVHKRGFFRGDAVVAQAQVELEPLLTQCEVVTDAELTPPGSRRPYGGTIKVSLRLREPMKQDELVRVEEKFLEVGEWPAIVEQAMPPAPAQSPAKQQPASSPVPAPAVQPQPAKPAAPAGSDDKYKTLTESEKTNPMSVEHIISNDVFENEIALLPTNPDKLSNEDRNLRQMQLETKMNVLVIRVQKEEVSLEQYCGMLDDRIKRDTLLAQYLKAHQRDKEALRVFSRVKIMQKELASASENQG